MMRKSNQELLSKIRIKTREVLISQLNPNGQILLIGFPSYTNPGDSMIWLGTLEYLQELNIEVLYRCDIGRFDQKYIDHKFPNVPILIQGGGNFGDLWPDFQDFRDSLVNQNKHRRIIQLPQSVHFVNGERAIQTNEALKKHPNFTLLVRDSNSLLRAKELFPDVETRFCPDLAFGLEVPSKKVPKGRTRVAILRKDREQLDDLRRKLNNYEITDWHLNFFEKLNWAKLRLILILFKRMPIMRVFIHQSTLERVYSKMSALNLKSALRIILSAQIVVTDRLHAHVLSLLCGIDNVVFDNSYRKISSIYQDYSGDFENTELCLNVEGLDKSIEVLHSAESKK
jgi:pyruvyl transferase EpsO